MLSHSHSFLPSPTSHIYVYYICSKTTRSILFYLAKMDDLQEFDRLLTIVSLTCSTKKRIVQSSPFRLVAASLSYSTHTLIDLDKVDLEFFNRLKNHPNVQDASGINASKSKCRDFKLTYNNVLRAVSLHQNGRIFVAGCTQMSQIIEISHLLFNALQLSQPTHICTPNIHRFSVCFKLDFIVNLELVSQRLYIPLEYTLVAYLKPNGDVFVMHAKNLQQVVQAHSAIISMLEHFLSIQNNKNVKLHSYQIVYSIHLQNNHSQPSELYRLYAYIYRKIHIT